MPTTTANSRLARYFAINKKSLFTAFFSKTKISLQFILIGIINTIDTLLLIINFYA